MRLPRFTRNFYFLALLFFFFWMFLIDSNDIISQIKLSNKLDNLKEEKAYYLEKIDEVKKEREQLFSNDENLERFAREKYLMKKETEDLFIVVEKE